MTQDGSSLRSSQEGGGREGGAYVEVFNEALTVCLEVGIVLSRKLSYISTVSSSVYIKGCGRGKEGCRRAVGMGGDG